MTALPPLVLVAQHVRPVARRVACAALLAGLHGACSLVGYDEQREPATAREDAGEPGDDASAARARDGATSELDGRVELLLDASPQGELDAGEDAMQGDAGWWAGKAADVVCPDGKKCYPTCEPAGAMCVFECADASDCEASCLRGTACHVACDVADTCSMACKEDGECTLDCEGSKSCEAWCTKDTHCQVDCADSEDCRATCLAGSSCEVDCSAGADCSEVTCSLGAACLVHCGPAGCDFACDGSGASCADNVEVCNRACP